MSDYTVIDETNPISEEEQMVDVSNGTDNEEQEEQVSKIPEKFRGKSQEELVEMYTNLEKDHSRLGNEVGETRKLVDELLKAELSRSTASAKQEEVVDWDYEPEKAAKRLVDTEVGSVKKELDQLKRKAEMDSFVSKNSDFIKDSQSQEYMDWVVKSEYRTKLHNINVQGFDKEAASELATSWREYKDVAQKVGEKESETRKEELKAASLEKGANTGGSRKKMWSRAYIRQLRLYEPSKYEANKAEIAAAYAEGRVTK